MAKRSNPFIKGLIEKYRHAAEQEKALAEAFEKASRALADVRETKKLCAALLRKEGIDADAIEASPSREPETAASSAEINGHAPLNATHAVYLIMRKRGNAGFRIEELERFSQEDGTPLTVREINKVLWTQIGKQRMEKTHDGRIRMTPIGETFNSFRRQNVEEKPITSNAHA